MSNPAFGFRSKMSDEIKQGMTQVLKKQQEGQR